MRWSLRKTQTKTKSWIESTIWILSGGDQLATADLTDLLVHGALLDVARDCEYWDFHWKLVEARETQVIDVETEAQSGQRFGSDEEQRSLRSIRR